MKAKISNILYLEHLLVHEKRRLSRNDLSKILNVSVRTINRYINDINIYYAERFIFDEIIQINNCYVLLENEKID